ncbi:hypothetical protein NBH00_05265 [Paraconexibacter antarcticus]|uniref:Uncharacterized protein n=1 Tax=Paraconexibacter antarcticus TaxID=2949664 RepID=A0ABY5DVV6_9ACTN|nr:hypothetical protein [Paraconexibacter antarcticus]UTI65620.1 hypothetical protein NBH00_05265 [Paraconexibacter antarcticus]
MIPRLGQEVRLHGASACHMRVVRADGRVEHYSHFSRPRPVYNLRAWLWLVARFLEYKQMEKNDAR